MKVCERNSCVCGTIATRDAVTGEEWLESLNANWERKLAGSYAVVVKKEGIIVGDLPQKIFYTCRITFVILCVMVSLP